MDAEKCLLNIIFATKCLNLSFNFTEAALLIHGTTSVYVKKVDYVHQLALNFFDQLREDPKQEKKRKDKGNIYPYHLRKNHQIK